MVVNSKALHEQLALIMAALSKAALADICAAVDQGFAVLQSEISRSHKENEDLKKKLHLIESIVLKGSNEGPAVETALERHSGGTRTASPAVPQLRQRDKERADAAGGAAAERPEAGEAPEEVPDVVLIKDEDSDTCDTFEEDEKPCVDSRGPLTPGAEDNAILRSPPSETNSNSSVHRSCQVYRVGSPQGEMGSVCSYSSQMDLDVHVMDQDCPVLPSVCVLGNRAPFFNNSSALADTQTPGLRAEPEPSSAWTTAYGTYHPENCEALGLKVLNVNGPIDSCRLSENSGSSSLEFNNSGRGHMSGFGFLGTDQPGSGGRSSPVKRFLCSVCNKMYATAQSLEVHMRIHTGERPFSCEHCGKRFTQSAHLKSHLSVHSGARPYTCSVCSRSFIVLNSLKLHMKKCHPDV